MGLVVPCLLFPAAEVDPGHRGAMRPVGFQNRDGRIGPVDLEPLFAIATPGQADVVKDAGGEQLSLSDVTSNDQTLVSGQKACEQITADAVIGD